MQEDQVKDWQEAILKYIKSQNNKEVEKIDLESNQEFTTQKSSYIEEEKKRIIQEYKNKLAQDEIRLKIQRSAKQNNARIQSMKTVNSLIEKLYKEAKGKLNAK